VADGEVVQGVTDRGALRALRKSTAGGVQGAGDGGLPHVEELAVLLPALRQAVGRLFPGEAAPLGEGIHQSIPTGAARGVDELSVFLEGGLGEPLAQLAAFLGPVVQVSVGVPRPPRLRPLVRAAGPDAKVLGDDPRLPVGSDQGPPAGAGPHDQR
jgi:hypothetical protein